MFSWAGWAGLDTVFLRTELTSCGVCQQDNSCHHSQHLARQTEHQGTNQQQWTIQHTGLFNQPLATIDPSYEWSHNGIMSVDVFVFSVLLTAGLFSWCHLGVGGHQDRKWSPVSREICLLWSQWSLIIISPDPSTLSLQCSCSTGNDNTSCCLSTPELLPDPSSLNISLCLQLC